MCWLHISSVFPTIIEHHAKHKIYYSIGIFISPSTFSKHFSLFNFSQPFLKMEIPVTSIAFSVAFVAVSACLWKLLDWVLLKPKKLEKFLRQQGFSGNHYKLFHGDTTEMIMMRKQAKTRPISPFSHDIASRVIPFHHHICRNYGVPFSSLRNLLFVNTLQ